MTEQGPERHHIRKYREQDRAQVRRICFETGLFGKPVRSVYGDEKSFADMFSGYYTDCEPESAWVVARDDDSVVGYLLGCVDTRRAWDPAKVGAKHVFTRGLLFRPSTAPFYLRLLWDVLRDGGVRRPKIDLDTYPAHFHINLLPEARGKFGIAMHDLFLDYLRARGVRGLHAELIAENTRSRRLSGHLGYTPIGDTFPLPGMRDERGARLHGLAIVREVRAAEPARAPRSRNESTPDTARTA